MRPALPITLLKSIQFREEGTVKVKYLVLKDGTVGECQVEISSGFPGLDDAACVRVRRWLFKPGSVMQSAPVQWWLDASIAYKLDARQCGVCRPT